MKIDRSKVKEFYLMGLTDKEIADKLNCRPQTVSIIRWEQKLYKQSQFYLKEYRRAYFNKKSLQVAVYMPMVMMNKLRFNREDLVYYKMTFEAPNRITLDFKYEKDIYDKDNIKKRRGVKSTTNVKNAENTLKMSEGS